MPIIFKSKLSSAVANATFLDKTIDDLKKGKLGLFKVTSSETDAVDDVQVFLNELSDASGVDGEGDATRKDYSSNSYVADGDNRKVAIGKLDAALTVSDNRITSIENDINTTQDLVKEPTGFPNRIDTTLSFDDSLREITIAPTGASFDVHVKGTKYVKGTESLVISNVDGNHYIYYSSAGVLTETTTFGPSIFEGNALVSIVYWNTSNQKAAYFADERHGLVMDGATHGYLHTVFGARYLSGYALQSFVVDGDGTLSTQAQFQADSGAIRDEDLIITSLATSTIPVLYRHGLLWRKKEADSFPLIYNGTAGYTGTNIAYNEFTGGAWQLTEVDDNDYVLIHVFATNDHQNPVIAILGTTSYANIPEARLGADTEITSISGLPFAEFVAVGSVIFQTNSAYTNAPKAIVRSADAGEEYVDFRGEQLYTPSGVATSHSLLSNLSSDDHLQYFNEARGDARYVIDGENLGLGEEVFKQKSGTDLQFKTIVAGTNVTLTPDADTITISSIDTGEVNTASNVGLGEDVFKQKVGVDLEFKTLVAGSNITLTPSADSITISSTDTGEVNTASNLGLTGEGVFAQKIGTDLQFKKLKPGTNVNFSSDAESITVNATGGGGGSGAGDLDTMLSQTFDDSALIDFTQTGLILDGVNELNGTKSAKLIHQASVNQSFKQTVAVSEKYRGQSMTVTVLAKSFASIGNVTILFRDETNAINIQSSQQIQADSIVKTFQFGVKIPSNCLSFSYTITALPQAGLVETFIDDISIKSYWMGTASQGQTEYSYEVPVVTDFGFTFPVTSNITTNVILTSSSRRVGDTFHCQGNLYFTGTNTQASAGIFLPTGLLFDTNKIGTSNRISVGQWFARNSLSGSVVTGNIVISTAVAGSSLVFLENFNPATNNPFTFAANFEVGFEFNIPIAGWEKSETKTFVSNDLVPAKAMNGSTSIEVPKITTQATYINSTGSVSAGSPITGVTSSSTGSELYSYNTTTGLYTILKTSSFSLAFSAGASSGYVQASLQLGSGEILAIGANDAASAGSWGQAAWSGVLVAGTTFSMIPISGTAVAWRTSVLATCSVDESKTWSSTQTLVTSEQDSVVRAVGNAGQLITVGVTDIPFNLISSQGNAIQFNGSSFTVLKDGIYSVDGGVLYNTNTVGRFQVLYINGSQAQGLNIRNGASQDIQKFQTERYFKEGEVVSIREGGITGTLLNNFIFHFLNITSQGSVKAIQTVSDQKIEIPTSELRFEGASTRGTIATAIVKFDTMTKIRGDAFSVVNDTSSGTVITMKKSGKLDVNASVIITSGASVSITKNQLNLSTFYTSGPETLSTQGSSATVNATSASWSGSVNVGDIIRIGAEAIPSTSVRNSLNLSFQEQTVAVSVSNTLPQFSESDSFLRVSGAAGFGSSATTTRRFASIHQNIGNDIQYVDSPTAGGQFIAKSSGLYNVSYSEYTTANTSEMSVELKVNGSIVALDNQALNTTAASNKWASASAPVYLNVGDIVTASVGAASQNNGSAVFFSISKVGKPNVTGVDVTPFIKIPQPISQSSFLDQNSSFTNAVITGTLLSNGNNGVFSYNSSTGFYTALKACAVSVHASMRTASAAPILINMVLNNSISYSVSNSLSISGAWASASFTAQLRVGETFDIRNQSGVTSDYQRISVTATALADQILTAPETFSTDTAALTYAGSGTYTLSTLANAPIGTFITYTMAATTNTRVQTTVAPTQTTSDMNANGILLYARGLGATSTAGGPAVVAIQIGKGLKGVSKSLYKSAGKVTAGNLDINALDGVTYGAIAKDYNELTGVLMIDAAWTATVQPAHSFLFSDVTAQAWGYLVINASKNPALTGLGIERVAARANQSSGQIIANTTLTTIVWDVGKTFDTNGALTTGSGVFTSPITGYYQVNGRVSFNGNTNGDRYGYLVANGFLYSILRTGAQTPATGSQVSLLVNDIVYLPKGTTCYIQVYQTSGVSLFLSANAQENYFSIAKI